MMFTELKPHMNQGQMYTLDTTAIFEEVYSFSLLCYTESISIHSVLNKNNFSNSKLRYLIHTMLFYLNVLWSAIIYVIGSIYILCSVCILRSDLMITMFGSVS